MTDQEISGAAAPSDGLRSTLEAAFAADFRDAEAQAELSPRSPLPRGPGPDTDQSDDPRPRGSGEPGDGERTRDEQGRFAPAKAGAGDPAPTASPLPAGQATAQPITSAEPLAAPRAAPPPGWSISAKAEFDKLPPAVQEAVAKREVEISNGFAKLADYKGLDPFVEMARANGQTLPQVVQAYVAAEQALEQDFGQGILSLCQMYNIDPAQLGQFLSGQQQGNQPPGAPDAFAPLVNRLSTIERQLEQREMDGLQAEISRFAADPQHRFFENVRQAMGQIIAGNPQASLSDAYDQACWANPEIRPLLIKEQTDAEAARSRAAADSARRASGSLPNGSPLPGAIPTGGPAPTLRAELERAFEAARI